MAFWEPCSAVNSNRMGIYLEHRQALVLLHFVSFKSWYRESNHQRRSALICYKAVRRLEARLWWTKVIRPISYRSYIADHSLKTKPHALGILPCRFVKDPNHRQVTAELMNNRAETEMPWRHLQISTLAGLRSTT